MTIVTMHLSILCIIFETAPLGGGWLSPSWGKYYPICDTVYSYLEKGCQKIVHNSER